MYYIFASIFNFLNAWFVEDSRIVVYTTSFNCYHTGCGWLKYVKKKEKSNLIQTCDWGKGEDYISS